MSFIKELKRRNVFRMVVLYAIAAWLIMQVADVLKDPASLPDWVGPTVLGLLAVGFPIALILSWFYEVTPEGITLEKDVDREESITHITGRRLDFLVISLLCAAVILFAYDKWWIDGPPQQSIAVFPFENLSADPDNEYFSKGMTAELISRLSRIQNLQVVSFFQTHEDIDKIGQELKVRYLLEGTVRRSGSRVRISALLIDTSTGFNLWSENFEGELQDVFDLQEQTALKIADALDIHLSPEEAAERHTYRETSTLRERNTHTETHIQRET